MKKTIQPNYLALATMLCMLAAPNLHAEIIFEDSFESADMNKTNEDGFDWKGNNNTSVVTQHETDGPVAVFNNGPIYNVHNNSMPDGTTRDWTAYNGDYSLRFRYAAGWEWSEQRFDLGRAYPELWFGFWLRVPTNFSYGTGKTLNNKFFSLWMDGYDVKGDGSTVWLGMWPHETTGAVLGFTYSKGDGTAAGGYQQNTPFITTADRGKWMQIVFHVKTQTSENSNDGIIRTYRRWENENDFTLLHETLNATLRIPDGEDAPKGFKLGYLLGWANATYANDTEWLLDDFTVSTTSLLTNIIPPSSPLLSIE